MPRNKKIKSVIFILFIIIIIIATIIIIYLNTDMFKSNETLFLKYLWRNEENIKEIEKIFEDIDYRKTFGNDKYIEESEIKINYTENYGTTSENTNNSINNLMLTINGQVDKENEYNYKDFKLWKDNEEILDIEYGQNDNNYGIRFSDLFKQFVLVENNNLQELLGRIGYSEQNIEGLSNGIEIKQDEVFNSLKFKNEEIQKLKEKYLNIINENVSNENFDKKANEIISINGENLIVNAYILELTNEQLNKMYVNILENLKKEEIVLSKLDKVQNYINKVHFTFSENINLKNNFLEQIENEIENINRTNIGIEETRIVVYENQGNTVRTTLQGLDYRINIDCIGIGEQQKFVEIILEDNKKQKLLINIKKNNEKINLSFENRLNDEQNVISFEESNKIEDKKSAKKINVKYEHNKNRIEANIITNINIVENFENVTVFDDKNSIKLNNLEEERLKIILNKLNEIVKTKFNSIAQEIKVEEIQNMLIDMELIRNTKRLEGVGITETEKNRFNSKFEILVGENIDSEDMLKIFKVIKQNLINIEVTSREQLKIEVNKNNKNDDMSLVLENFIKKDKNKKYNLSIEYDGESGLIKYIVLTLVR